MNAAIKTLISLLTSKKGRNTLKTVIIIILSPALLCLLLVVGAADGGAKHNNHMIETVFNDLPVSASVPLEFKAFVENFKYAFKQIDVEITLIESEVDGNLDSIFIKSTIYSLFVDADSNASLLELDYSEYLNCFISTETIEIEIESEEETEESAMMEVVTKQVITDNNTIFSNVAAYFNIEITEEKTSMIYEIYGQVNSNFGDGYDLYTSTLGLLKEAIEQSELTIYVGGEFGSPFSDGWQNDVTSEFGKRTPITLEDGTITSSVHTGLDIAKPMGTPIQVVNDGTVVLVRNTKIGLGLYVVVDHGGGIFTVYGHTSRILVQVGDTVTKGDIIAEVGSSGYSTGPHLHLEVIEQSKYINPRNYLK